MISDTPPRCLEFAFRCFPSHRPSPSLVRFYQLWQTMRKHELKGMKASRAHRHWKTIYLQSSPKSCHPNPPDPSPITHYPCLSHPYNPRRLACSLYSLRPIPPRQKLIQKPPRFASHAHSSSPRVRHSPNSLRDISSTVRITQVPIRGGRAGEWRTRRGSWRIG
ncbi:hypothetical protein BDV93DRAFT_372160 [Ceratobasidium sp. AG-I]|nr:hypothetical protein BDV93DRAFT_372160 [Ceratobasidium sp. AG-I]